MHYACKNKCEQIFAECGKFEYTWPALSHDPETILQIHHPNVEVIFLLPATYEPWSYQDITLEISTGV
jgi:hypothetical protein